MMVVFPVDRAVSVARGYFESPKVLRLTVTPAAADGTLLGPGWGKRVRFLSLRGARRIIAARDENNGSYSVRIELDLDNPKLDLDGPMLTADHIGLAADGLKWELPGRTLTPNSFGAKVLGKFIPITLEAFPEDLGAITPHGRPRLANALAEVYSAVEAGIKLTSEEAGMLGQLVMALDAALVPPPIDSAANARVRVHVLRSACGTVAEAAARFPDCAVRRVLHALAVGFDHMVDRWPAFDTDDATAARAFFTDLDELRTAIGALGKYGTPPGARPQVPGGKPTRRPKPTGKPKRRVKK
jgi:hypothetical protein